MIDGAPAFPPLCPGSTRTTWPSRTPLAVGGNRPGPPSPALGTRGGLELVPAAARGVWLAVGRAGAGEFRGVVAAAEGAAAGPGDGECWAAAGLLNAWVTSGPVPAQADRSRAIRGSVHRSRDARSRAT